MTAGSVHATAPSTTPRVVFAKVRRRKISRSRPTRLFPTRKSKSAERTSHSRFNHERTLDLPTAEQGSAMARETVADRWPGTFFLRGLPGAAQSELSVDVRRHPRIHARRADHHRRRAGDALYAAG